MFGKHGIGYQTRFGDSKYNPPKSKHKPKLSAPISDVSLTSKNGYYAENGHTDDLVYQVQQLKSILTDVNKQMASLRERMMVLETANNEKVISRLSAVTLPAPGDLQTSRILSTPGDAPGTITLGLGAARTSTLSLGAPGISTLGTTPIANIALINS